MATKDRPPKRAKLLSASSSDSDSDSDNAGVHLPAENGFRINEDYARRFEHNKKREERQRLEEKYAASAHKRKRDAADSEGSEEDDSSSSDSETEDSDAVLATEELDREIDSTLQAIRRKDPRVYDPHVRFYRAFDPDEVDGRREGGEARPMYLKDYHRENLLAGHTGAEEEAEEGLEGTYVREQEKLKKEVVGSMHAAAAAVEDDDEDFLIAKSRHHPQQDEAPQLTKPTITAADVASADQDPETYLSNFMAARAWLPPEGLHSRYAPLSEEEDDSEDDRRAEAFEHAYNMRFEDPATANETLRTFARDIAAGNSVRRDTTTGTRRAKRAREKEEKARAKREREEEKARLRRLRIEEMEAKVARIREVAGLGAGEVVDVEAWRELLDGGEWEEDAWERLVGEKVFGEGYYASGEAGKGKPKWEDEIGIDDLVPDFQEREEVDSSDAGQQDGIDNAQLPGDNDEDEDGDGDLNMDADYPTGSQHPPKNRSKKSTKKKTREQDRATARRQRRQIEALVDSTLPEITTAINNGKTGFRYRSTSPTSFGLTARDILFASDAQLNAFAGLKKLAPFRPEEKKRRDRKRLGKKARLREWRRETFGKEIEEEEVGGDGVNGVVGDGERPRNGEKKGEEKKKKKKRRRKAKVMGKSSEEEMEGKD